jgi:hypothetical protein
MYVTPTGGTASAAASQRRWTTSCVPVPGGGGVRPLRAIVTHYALLGLTSSRCTRPLRRRTLTIWYVALPTALSAQRRGSDPAGAVCVEAARVRRVGRGGGLEGRPVGAGVPAAVRGVAQKFRSHLTRKAGRQPGQFQLVPRSTFPPHDPSTDGGARCRQGYLLTLRREARQLAYMYGTHAWVPITTRTGPGHGP